MERQTSQWKADTYASQHQRRFDNRQAGRKQGDRVEDEQEGRAYRDYNHGAGLGLSDSFQARSICELV